MGADPHESRQGDFDYLIDTPAKRTEMEKIIRELGFDGRHGDAIPFDGSHCANRFYVCTLEVSTRSFWVHQERPLDDDATSAEYYAHISDPVFEKVIADITAYALAARC